MGSDGGLIPSRSGGALKAWSDRRRSTLWATQLQSVLAAAALAALPLRAFLLFASLLLLVLGEGAAELNWLLGADGLGHGER
jgi:hypothetical protein